MAPVDQGWAWMTVFGSFVSFMIVDGMERSFGIWYVEILHRYDSSSAITAWISGINTGVRLLLSPFVSAVCYRLAPQKVTMLGGLIWGLGVFISAFVEDAALLILTFGVVSGIGGALTYLPCYLSMSTYFVKYKGVAFALAQCGSGFGSFVFSPLLSYLFSNFSYVETVTILAGLSLQIIPAGALFFPRQSSSSEHAVSRKRHQRVLSSHSLVGAGELYVDNLKESSFGHEIPQSPTRSSAGGENIPLLEKGNEESSENGRESTGFRFELLTNPIVILIMIGTCFFMWCSFPFIIMVLDFSVERGVSVESGTLILFICGAVESPVRLLSCLVLQHRSVRSFAFPIWACCSAGVGLTAFLTALCTQLPHFIVTSVLNVAFVGSFGSLAPLAFSVCFTDDCFSEVMSLYSFGLGVGSITGTVVSGWLRDVTHSYVLSYISMGCEALFSSALLLLSFSLIVRFRKRGEMRLRPAVEM